MTSSELYDITILLRVGARERRVPLAEFAFTLHLHPDVLRRHCDAMLRVAQPPEITADPSAPTPVAVAEEGGRGEEGTDGTGTVPTGQENDRSPVSGTGPDGTDGSAQESAAQPRGPSVAWRFAQALNDLESLPAFERLAARYPEHLLDQALRLTLAMPAGELRNRAAYFTHKVRQLADAAGFVAERVHHLLDRH